MAQAGFTPIITYHSTTAAAVPTAGNLAPGEMALNIADMKLYAENSSGVVTLLASSSGASGDVVGPASATDNAVTRFDGTTGKLVQNSGVTIDDSNNVSGVAQLNATTADLTNIEVTNIKAKDGTAAGSIADSTGVVTLGSSVLTTTDINGGTIDNTAIGGATPAAGAFTTLSASSTVTLSGGTANGVAYLNGSKVLTTGSALTFDGTNLANTLSVNASAGIRVTNSNAGTATSTNTSYSNGTNAHEFGILGTGYTTYGVLAAGDAYIYAGGSKNISLSADGGAIKFGAGAGGTEQMRLTSTGLGIGTSSPTEKLHVQKASAAYVLTESTTATNSGYRLKNTQRDWYLLNDSNGRFALYDDTAAATRLQVDSSGNLGLGVTPSAWGSNYRAVEVSGAVNVFGNTGDANFAGIGANLYHNNTNYLYRYSTLATMYLQDNGTHQWHTAPSGTAGDAITFTQAMTLDASGNLLVGGTSVATTDPGSPQINLINGVTTDSQWTGRLVSRNTGNNTAVFIGNYRTSSTNKVAVVAAHSAALDAWAPLYVNTVDGTPSNGGNVIMGGNLLIGYTSSNGAYLLQVNSQIFATNATIATSDGRYKENIQSLEGALNLVSQLNPVQFSWKKHPVHNFDLSGPTIGFIAQEVEQVLADKPYLNSIIKRNECVIEPEEKDAEGNVTKEAVTEEFLGIAEGNMIALLTKALQELKADFDAYKASHP